MAGQSLQLEEAREVEQGGEADDEKKGPDPAVCWNVSARDYINFTQGEGKCDPQ